ncbi:MAG: branched-chain amino acid ABC transporter substrate-binding protein [Deltaproteobacteria bacterium]|nr:branched-chain amino acid ABC transporter substrate-binding protein [Deltaproteobacteria bacterium]
MKALVWMVIPWLVGSCALPTAPEALRVAVSVPKADPFGASVLRGMELALADREGRAGDHAVELLVFDTMPRDQPPETSRSIEREAAEAAIADPRVVAYLGPVSSHQASISMPLLNEAQIAQISPTATWPGLTRPGFGPGEPARYFPSGRSHFFRVVPTDSVQAAAAARWAHRLGLEATALIHDSQSHGRGASGIFEEAARDLGLKIVGRYHLPPAIQRTSQEMQTLAAQVLASEPNLVYLSAGSPSGLSDLVLQLRRENPRISILGVDILMLGDVVEPLDPAISEGLLATSFSLPVEHLGTAGALAFRHRYRQLYHQEPRPEAASGYEAMNTLLQAISETASGSRQQVLESMSKLREVSGILGRWHFDEFGDTSLAVVGGFRVRQGRWTFEERLR